MVQSENTFANLAFSCTTKLPNKAFVKFFRTLGRIRFFQLSLE